MLHVTGLVAIVYGSQTLDPVTGGLARVVGARLDASRRTVVPVTANYWLAVWDHPDSVEVGVKTSATHRERLIRGNRARQCWFICQMEALQREACARDTYWQQQRKREDDFLCDLDSAVVQSLFRVSESNLYQVLDDWMIANFHPPSLVQLQHLLWPRSGRGAS